MMTEANIIYKIWDLYSSMLFESCCVLSDQVFSEPWCNQQFEETQGKRDLIAVMPRRMQNDETIFPEEDNTKQFG